MSDKINKIRKAYSHEDIQYKKVTNDVVCKMYFAKCGKLRKKKMINVKEIQRNRRRYRDVQDFFEDMVYNHDYDKIN